MEPSSVGERTVLSAMKVGREQTQESPGLCRPAAKSTGLAVKMGTRSISASCVQGV